jgi:hypothetical protein
MELADLLFVVRSTSPALQRISLLFFRQLRPGMDGNLACGVGATPPAFNMFYVPFPQLLRHLDDISIPSIGRKLENQSEERAHVDQKLSELLCISGWALDQWC